MKHVGRTIALLVIASLAAGPALAAYACNGSCAMQISGHECCVGASDSRAGSMRQMDLMTGCGMNRGAVVAQACCDREIAPRLQYPAKAQGLAVGDGKNLNAITTAGSIALTVPEADDRGSGAAAPIGLISERCILFHLFRI